MTRSRDWTSLLLAAIPLACATAPEPKSKRPIDLVADPALQGQSEAQRAAWLAYGIGRAVFYDELKSQRKNPAEDDYLIELRARAKLAQVWHDQRARADVPADAY